MNLFFIVAATSIPGFLSYVYLSKLQIIHFSKDEKDDKVITLSILSLLNVGTSFIVFYFITGVTPTKDMSMISLVGLISVSILISSIMTFGIYPIFLKLTAKSISKYQQENNMGRTSSKEVKDLVFNNPKYKFTMIYIFDLENNFIESGYLNRFSNINEGNLKLSLDTDTAYSADNPIDFSEVLKAFNESENLDAKEIYLDFETKVKIFVFHHN